MPAVLPSTAAGSAVAGPPCRSPRRAVRVGTVPRPRVRPLADVLAALAHEREVVDAGPPVTPAGAGQGAVPDVGPLVEAARPVALRLFSAVAEILDGRRPPEHLRGPCDPEVYDRVVAGLAPARRSGGRGRVRGVRVCAVTASIAEAAAVLHRDERARALAARLERVDGTWRVRALLVG